jgi:hypothetical protein
MPLPNETMRKRFFWPGYYDQSINVFNSRLLFIIDLLEIFSGQFFCSCPLREGRRTAGMGASAVLSAANLLKLGAGLLRSAARGLRPHGQE